MVPQDLTSPDENSRCPESLRSFPYAASLAPQKILLTARKSPSPTGESGAGFRARVPTLEPHTQRLTPRGRARTKARGWLTHPRGEGGRVAKAPRSARAPLLQASGAGPELAPPRAAVRAARVAGEARPGRAGRDRGEPPGRKQVQSKERTRVCEH